MFTGTLERFGGREPRQIRVFIEGIARQAIHLRLISIKKHKKRGMQSAEFGMMMADDGQ